MCFRSQLTDLFGNIKRVTTWIDFQLANLFSNTKRVPNMTIMHSLSIRQFVRHNYINVLSPEEYVWPQLDFDY